MMEEIKTWLMTFVSDGAGKLVSALLILACGIVVIRTIMTILN